MRVMVGLAIAGCGGSQSQPVATKPAPVANDGCEAIAGKLRPLAAANAEAQRAQFLERCRAEGGPDSITACVTGAADAKAVRACVMAAPPGKRMASEAVVQLARIASAVEAIYGTNGQFPTTSAALTPATACCAQPDHACKSEVAAWAGPAWQVLELHITEPSQFQYSYSGDGTSFTVKAVGDLDCDNTAITYTLAGSLVDGKLKLELTEPPAGTD